MRTFSLLAVGASLFALVAAQTIPDCATPCLTEAIANSASSGCGTSLSCLCANNAFLTSALACVQSSCTGSDLQTAISAAEAQCAANGVTVNPSTLTGASTAAGSGTASGSPSASVTGSASSASASASGSSASGSSTSSSASASSASASASSAAMLGNNVQTGLMGAVLAFVGAAVAL